MTNKIIIDGIDVSECKCIEFESYAEPYCNNNDGEDLDCGSYPNCYYKQLKRKEQALDKIEKLISEALDPEKTETEQSFNNFYECLDIIEKSRKE